MAQNPRGLLQVLDEASTLTSSMNQYRGGKGSDRQWYMSAWSGEARIVDRKGNADNAPIHIPNQFLCVVGGMVPDMIGSLCDAKGRHEGFIDRILFTYPDPVPKTGWQEEGVPETVSAEWSELVRRLHARPLTVENLRTLPHIINFTPAGKTAWCAMIDASHAEQQSVDFPQSLVGPWSKLEQYAGRLTLILHLLRHASGSGVGQSIIPDVTAETVGDARRLLVYLKSHTRRIHEAMKAGARGEEGSEDVQSILKWILRHRKEAFSLRDLTRDLTRTFGKRAHALTEALDWLSNRDCIRAQAASEPNAKKARGRSKSRVYLVNPHLHESQNCQNHMPGHMTRQRPDQTGDFGDSATDDPGLDRTEDSDEIPF
ncbi:MAG: hypothetical protein JWN86_468 [Planctomycetota bacterium]|nr:hypothetical protein [Planctomycetota bacterium]